MAEEFKRTELLLGSAAVSRLKMARVIVFGIGGVGGTCTEALARSGVGRLVLVDPDVVSLSNINRQIIALHSTVGQNKAEAMRQRIADIHPETNVTAYPVFYEASTADQFDLSEFDYIVDAIDSVTSKLLLVERAQQAGTPVISCMGAGNKLDPSRFEVADIYDTSVCPLAKVMRKELRERAIPSLKVVYSKEPPIKIEVIDPASLPEGKRQVPGSVSFVPPAAGLVLAGAVIRDLVDI